MSEIKLTSRHYKILKHFAKKITLQEHEYTKYQKDKKYIHAFKQLEELDYIFEHMRIEADEYVYIITTDGLNEYQRYVDEQSKFWFNAIIGILALLATIISIFLAL